MSHGLAYRWSIVDWSFRALATLRRFRRVDPAKLLGEGQPVKVNVGSALAVAPGWINLDANLSEYLAKLPEGWLRRLHGVAYVRDEMPPQEYVRRLKGHVFLHHDFARYGLPFEDASVDYAYSSHVLEHLYREDALALLREMHRVLKPGGLVRSVVPDLALVVELYHKGDAEGALGYLFMPRKHSDFGRHRYMYDFPLVRKLHEEAGFTSVTRWPYQQGRVPDAALLDNRPTESLYVEAAKPA